MISYHLLAPSTCFSDLMNPEVKNQITYIEKLHFWNNQLLGFYSCYWWVIL